MTDSQLQAFKTAANINDIGLLRFICLGSFIAVLMLWVGWSFVAVYRGWAAGNVKAAVAMRFVIRAISLIVVTLFLYTQ